MENRIVIIEESNRTKTALYSNWPDFVNCSERLKQVGPFLQKHLPDSSNSKILDAAMGIGCDSLYLIKKGYDVISNEIDENFIKIASEKAWKSNLNLLISKSNWLELCEEFNNSFFDGIFLIGNSICLLDDHIDVKMALQNFFTILREGGTFIIDERNFPYFQREKIEILNGHFRYSAKYLYCGKLVKGIPTEITNNNVVFSYYRENKLLGRLKMLSFEKDELKNLLYEIGFKKIEIYSDFTSGYNLNSDFFTYVCTK